MNSGYEARSDLGLARSEDHDDETDLLQYWTVVSRYKWSIVGLTLFVCVIVYIASLALTPMYRSTATLLIESQDANVVSIEEVYGIDASKREYYQTQFEILDSRKLSEDVIRKLDIQYHPEYALDSTELSLKSFIPFLPASTPLTEEQEWQRVVAQFRENLYIEPIRNTQLVNVHFESSDSELAHKVANALGESYIESYLESQLELTQQAAQWLTTRLKGMRIELEASEERLQKFQETENLVDVQGVETLTAQELNELTRKLVEARNRTSASRSQLDAVGPMTEEYQQRWETLPGVLEDELAQRLKQDEADAENTFSEIVERYGPKHPRYIATRTRLETARRAHEERVRKVVRGFEEDYQQLLADQRQIERELDQAKQDIQGINRKQYQLTELQREVQTNRQLYNMFFTRFRETSETNFHAANARFVDRATKTFEPVRPRKGLITALAAALTLLIGVMLAFLRFALDNTVRVASEIEEKLGQSVLGVIPFEEPEPDTESHAPVLYSQSGHHTFSEAIRSLRTSVVLSGFDSAHKVIVVTSSVPSEGKTTISSNLALALGQMEKVLLIDADMRRPSIADEYGIEGLHPGLSEVVAHTHELSECIRSFPEMSIEVLSAGTIPPNPLDLLSSKHFDDLLVDLRQRYDRIIIDSAPTQAVSDALVLSSKADALIYVVKSDSTSVNVIQNGIQRLLRVRAPIAGVVLNQFDPKAAAKYGYEGYSKDGYYAHGYASKAYE